VGRALETEEKVIEADVTVWSEPVSHGREVDGAVMLVDLDGVASAEGDVRATFSGEMSEDAFATDFAVRKWLGGGDLRSLACPEIEGEQGSAHEMRLTGEEFEGFGDLKGGGEVDGGGEDAGGIAGLDRTCGGLGEDAGEAGGGGCAEIWNRRSFDSALRAALRMTHIIFRVSWEDVHCGGVGGNGGGVYPGLGLLNGVVVEEVSGLEVVGRVEDDLGGAEELRDVAGDEVSDVGVDLDGGVEEGYLAAGRFGLGESFKGVLFVEENLALEVGGLDEVAVEEGEGSNAGACEERRSGGSSGSAPDDGGV